MTDEHHPGTGPQTDAATDSVLDDPDLRLALRQSMAGRIDAFQPIVDDHTVYCEQCDIELDWTPSVLLVHNVRHHEEALDGDGDE